MTGGSESRPSLAFVRRPGGFDRWGAYHHMAGNLGPFLFAPPAERTDAFRFLFPVSWLVDPAFARRTDGSGLGTAGFDAPSLALLAAATYPDVYNEGRRMRAFAAHAVLTDDGTRYGAFAAASGANPYLRGSAEAAADWAETLANGSSWRDQPGMVERGTMGTGYTENTLPSDGSPDVAFAAVETTDGSLLAGWAVTWHNK